MSSTFIFVRLRCVCFRCRRPTWKDGTTATTIFLLNSTVYCANIGDSRASDITLVIFIFIVFFGGGGGRDEILSFGILFAEGKETFTSANEKEGVLKIR